MEKVHKKIQEFYEKGDAENIRPIAERFNNIFSINNIDINKRLVPENLVPEKIDKAIAQFERREKSRDDKKFYRFQVYADGIFLIKFDDNNQGITQLIELPISTSLLEIAGETFAGETILLSCFMVPNIYDPDLAEQDAEVGVHHKNIEISTKFFFEDEERLRVRIEIAKRLPHLSFVERYSSSTKSEIEIFRALEAVDSAVSDSNSVVRILDNKFLSFDEPTVSKAKIKVVGVGGGGGNALDRMIAAGIGGVDFITINTDIQALNLSKSPVKIQIGSKLTRGLGAGADPAVGREAALQDSQRILEALEGADMIFVTAGFGGGTGTGAAPVVASLARSLEILTIGVVTKPFIIEGKKRMRQAEKGLKELHGCIDTVITIPNSKIYEAKEKISIIDAFRRADNVLLQAIRGISDLITTPGIINLDFADIRSVIKDRGVALLGIGEARGEKAAICATKAALQSRFFEECSIKGATKILTNFNCSKATPLNDIEEAVALLTRDTCENVDIFLGTSYNDCENYVQIMFIATGDFAFSESGSAQSSITEIIERNVNNLSTHKIIGTVAKLGQFNGIF